MDLTPAGGSAAGDLHARPDVLLIMERHAEDRIEAERVEPGAVGARLAAHACGELIPTLRAQLAEILATAKKASGEEAWRTKVVGPLRVTVVDLVAGIERRQRGLDAQQEEVQAEIAKLLSADWFSAVGRCQSLLDATTSTLRPGR